MTTSVAKVTKTFWFLPAFSLLLGGMILGAFWIGGNPRDGLFGLLVMAVLALLILVGGRSEMVRGLRGDGRDEYWERIDLHATTLSGMAVLTVVIAMCLWEWAHGRDGSPYAALGAIGGVTYVISLAVLRWRS